MKLLVVLLFVLSLPSLAAATMYRLDFAGTLQGLGDTGGYADFTNGDRVSGYSLIDLVHAPADSAAREQFGQYQTKYVGAIFDSSVMQSRWLETNINGLNLPSLTDTALTGHRTKTISLSTTTSSARIIDAQSTGSASASCGRSRVFCESYLFDIKLDKSALTSDELVALSALNSATSATLSFFVDHNQSDVAVNFKGMLDIDQLSVTPVPLPAAIWPFALAMLALLGLRKRAS